MTAFILSVDRHVILKRFREEAPLFCLFYLISPTAAYWRYLSFAIIGIICHWYKETILGFIWSLHYGCLRYNWVKLDTIVKWNEKIMPSIIRTIMTGFLWVRGVTCCLNFHVSLISSVSQWTWHLMPLKNGIMNLSFCISPSVGYIEYSVFTTLNMFLSYRRVRNGTFSSQRGWGDIFLDDWAYCAFLFKLSA